MLSNFIKSLGLKWYEARRSGGQILYKISAAISTKIDIFSSTFLIGKSYNFRRQTADVCVYFSSVFFLSKIYL